MVLASHRAIYNVTLVRASQAEGVRSAFGSTTYTLTDRCDGYTIESTLHLEMGLSTGSESTIDQQYAAWEAKDNRSTSFRMLSHENGELKASYHGTATLDATGAGTATYSDDQQGEPTTFDLPAGTLLSTGHMVALLTSAARGETSVNRTVLDGSFDDGPYRIAAVIDPRAQEALPAADSGGLETGVLRPVALAYFSPRIPRGRASIRTHHDSLSKRRRATHGPGFRRVHPGVRSGPCRAHCRATLLRGTSSTT